MAKETDHSPENGLRQAVKIAVARNPDDPLAVAGVSMAEVERVLEVSHEAAMAAMNDDEVLDFGTLAVRIYANREE
jgi:hypothetical protein